MDLKKGGNDHAAMSVSSYQNRKTREEKKNYLNTSRIITSSRVIDYFKTDRIQESEHTTNVQRCVTN